MTYPSRRSFLMPGLAMLAAKGMEGLPSKMRPTDLLGRPMEFIPKSMQKELDKEWQEEPVGKSANGEFLWDESAFDSPFKTNLDRFRLGVTVKQKQVAVIDHDRLPWDKQTQISKIVGHGPMGWGQFIEKLDEPQWKTIAVMIAEVCGTKITSDDVCGFRLTETTNRGNGHAVWGLYVYTKA